MIKSLVNGIWEYLPDQSLKIGEDTFGFNNGLYETFRTLSFKPIFLDEHIDRLVGSAKIIGLKRFYSKNQIYDMTVRVIEDFKKPDQLARIILVKEKLIIYTTALKLNQDIYNGVKTITCRADRNNPEIKATNYRVCLEAWKKAKKVNCFEALLVDGNNYLLEGSRSNIFWVKNNVIYTQKNEVLPGITRQILMTRSPIKILFGNLDKKNIHDIDEFFITNSSSGIIPVTKIDKVNIGSGKPGTTTIKLLKEYNKWLHMQ